MDLDAALNELGMLSSVTDSRRQYLLECRRHQSRERTTSEPMTSLRDNDASASSHNKINFQLLQMNPVYVTSVNTGSSLWKTPGDGTFCQEQENIDVLQKQTKHTRRAKRFRKPYEMPWLQRHSKLQPNRKKGASRNCDSAAVASMASGARSQSKAQHCDAAAVIQVSINPSAVLEATSTQASSSTGGDIVTSSGSGPPPHSSLAPPTPSVPRSKSLDQLDFEKLSVAELENQNYLLEKREIEKVSHHLQNLNVTD